MVVPGSELVIKSVSQKLKHYFEVKRLEDGFDLSGVDCPKLDHPPIKARPTLQYDGLHDKPLKHYFGDGHVRVRLTKWVAPPNDPQNRIVKKKLIKYMDDMKYVHPYLPEYSYVHYPRGKMILRPEYQGFGRQLPATKKPHKGGYPILRTRPSHQISRGEAGRLVNTASRLLVNSQCVELFDTSHEHDRCRSLSRERRGTSSESRSRSARPARSKSAKSTSKSGKYVYDIHGRRVQPDPDDVRRKESERYHYIDYEDGKPMPKWLRREIRKRDREDGEDVQNQFVRSVSSSGASLRHSSGRPSSGRPSSGRPSSGRPSSERPSSGRPSSERHSGATSPDDDRTDGTATPSARRPLSAKKERTPPSRVSQDNTKNVTENTAVQTDLDLIDANNVMERVVTSGVHAKYRVLVRTGMKLGASTDADVFITLYGTKGRSDEIVLLDSKRHKAKFRKSQEDEFHINTYHVGELKHIRIGHNRKELGSGWYLESVVVIDLHDRISYTFPCNRWLSYSDHDKRTKRILEVKQFRNLPPDSEVSDSEDDLSRFSPTPVHSPRSERSSTGQRSGAMSPTPGSQGRPDSSSMYVNASTSERKDGKRSEESDYSYSDSDDSSSERIPVVDLTSTPTSKPRSGSPRTPTPKKSPSTDYDHGSQPARAVGTEYSSEEDEQDFCIHTAAKDGNLGLVKDIINDNPELIDSVSDSGVTALHLAASHGHAGLLQWLLVNCANINIRTQAGDHVTHLAAMNGHIECLRVLYALGAKLVEVTGNGQTLLHVAARGGHRSTCEWLLSNGALLQAEDVNGNTALDLAQEHKQYAIVHLLTAHAKSSKPKSEIEPSSNLASSYDDEDVKLAAISEESQPPPITSSQVVEHSDTFSPDGAATIFTEGTLSSSTPRIDLNHDGHAHELDDKRFWDL